jgi:predicted extracellular nuclease
MHQAKWMMPAVAALLLAAAGARAQACTGSVTPISEVQGASHDPALAGTQVTVRGVVTLVEDNLFYVQVRPLCIDIASDQRLAAAQCCEG